MKLKCPCGVELDSDELVENNTFQEAMNIILEHMNHIIHSSMRNPDEEELIF